MKRTLTILIPLAACGFALAAAPSTRPQSSQQQSARAARPPSYSDRYAILSQRNIFLKDRSRGGSRNGSTTGPTSSSSSQSSHRSPEETLALRGIVVEQGEVRAYFEDTVNSRMLRVAVGETIARGRIASIGLDAVEYEHAATGSGGTSSTPAQRTVVAVGHDLTGKVSDFDNGSSAAAMATTSPVMPSGVEGLNPNDPNLTPEQRMKLRRAMELKK